jgi:regulator of replication initiation timing
MNPIKKLIKAITSSKLQLVEENHRLKIELGKQYDRMAVLAQRYSNLKRKSKKWVTEKAQDGDLA